MTGVADQIDIVRNGSVKRDAFPITSLSAEPEAALRDSFLQVEAVAKILQGGDGAFATRKHDSGDLFWKCLLKLFNCCRDPCWVDQLVVVAESKSFEEIQGL